MLKNLKNLSGASQVSKDNQKSVNGGIKLRPSQDCSVICQSASHGTPCGPPHCPGMCLGNGQWVNY